MEEITTPTHQHLSTLTFAGSQFVSLSDDKNENVDKRIQIQATKLSKDGFLNDLTLIHPELYEFNDMNKSYIKPHFEIDFQWNEINHTKRDELIINACAFIVEHFNCNFESICVLYDEKPSKCSIHMNITDVYTTMEQLIQFKRENIEGMNQCYFDPAIYRMGQNKWRSLYACKVKDGKCVGTGLQKLAMDDLNIYEHADIDYLITYTADWMVPWTFENHPLHSFKAGIHEPTKVIQKIAPSKAIHSYMEANADRGAKTEKHSNNRNKSLILQLIDLIKNEFIQEHKAHSTMVKGLINDGYKDEAKILFDKYVSKTGKNLTKLWNDWVKQAYKCKYTSGTLFHFAKQSNKDAYTELMRKQCKTSLPPALHDDLFTLRCGITHKMNERYLPKETLEIIEKNNVTFIRSHLGTGKTTIMKQVIAQNPDKNILYLAPRITFAKQVCSELKGFTYYGDLRKTTLPTLKKRIVIQMESLHKVSEMSYDIVILDEPESCLKQLSSVETMKTRILQNHKQFERMLQNAEKVICCDAFLSNKTTEIVNKIVNKKEMKTTATIINEYNPYQRKAFEVKNDVALIKQVKTDLKNNKRIAFVCGSKSKAETIVREIREEMPDKNIRFYYGNMDEQHKQFSNVNEDWNDVDLLIYTPVITCGVNYDPSTPTFHKLYIYGTPHSACVRDVFQASLRVRKLIDNECVYAISNMTNNKQNYEVGTEENYRAILERKAFVEKNTVFAFDKVEDWVLWNYAYNSNEEGIKLKFYREAFYDYLTACGYDNKKHQQKRKQKQNIDGTYTEFENVQSITSEEYEDLQKQYHSLTEEQKNSMKLYEWNRVVDIDADLWKTLQLNPQIVNNLAVEFQFTEQELYEAEENNADKYIHIYDPNYVMKKQAIQKLNTLMGAENSLTVEYKNSFIKSKMNDFEEYINTFRPLWGLRKNRGKAIDLRYINSCIQTIYTAWNGCEFVKKETKTEQKKDYRYIQSDNGMLEKIKIH